MTSTLLQPAGAGPSASGSRRPRVRPSRVLLYAALIALALLYLLPVYVVVVGSLKSATEIGTSSIWALPQNPTLSPWHVALTPPLVNSGGIASGLANSFLMTIPAVIVSSLWGAVNGYALSAWRFRGADLLFTLILFGLFIPYQAVLIPLLRTLQLVHLYDSLIGLSLVHIIYGLPITTLIFRNFYAAIPNELLDAAKVDGGTFWSIFRRVMLPLSIPGFLVVGIWQFTSIWNEFLFAVTLTSSPGTQPVTVSLQNLAGSFAAAYNVQMAGALITAVPTLVVFILLGRYFVRGLLAGSLKG
jgi:glucose/mannose transport system permease protein